MATSRGDSLAALKEGVKRGDAQAQFLLGHHQVTRQFHVAQGELLAGLGHELAADDHPDIVEIEHALALERLQQILREFRHFHHFRTNLLEDFLEYLGTPSAD